MAMIQFLKGTQAGLNACVAGSTIVDGALYFTTDSHKVYMGTGTNSVQEFSAIEVVNNIAALPESNSAIEGKFYYAKGENVFCFPGADGWHQVNPDTGATSVEVVGSGNAVTEASYDAVSRKLTLTMGATYTTADDVDSAITTAVGNLGDKEPDVPYANVKEYVDEKIADVVAGSIEGLGNLASKDEVAESDLEATLAAKINGKADVGTDDDEATADTVKGAKKYAEAEADAAETAAKAYADGLVGALDVADSAVATQLVSAVSEEDGKITVTRRALVAEDIPEIAQSKVTGLTNALDGKQDSLVFNTAYDGSTNKVATMTDVTNAVAGLSGAMHYIGESTTDPATEVTVSGVDEFAKGDVVTYNAKEYVYDGTEWRELGDESSFAVKGSIKNADIAADAAIDQSKIAGLTDALAAKATPADITSAINGLDVPDEAESGKFVTAVVETDGKIAVSRNALVADDIPTLEIAKVNGLQAALDGKAVGSDITNAIAALDVEDTAVDGKVVSAVSEVDGKISVSRRALVAADIPELAQSKVTGLTTALAGKQDSLTFNTAYDASSNKAATMTDVDAAETAAKAYTDTALTWGSF